MKSKRNDSASWGKRTSSLGIILEQVELFFTSLAWMLSSLTGVGVFNGPLTGTALEKLVEKKRSGQTCVKPGLVSPRPTSVHVSLHAERLLETNRKMNGGKH